MRNAWLGCTAPVLFGLGSVSSAEGFVPSATCRCGFIIEQRGKMCSDKQSAARLRMLDKTKMIVVAMMINY
jgi:hypothetical protein